MNYWPLAWFYLSRRVSQLPQNHKKMDDIKKEQLKKGYSPDKDITKGIN